MVSLKIKYKNQIVLYFSLILVVVGISFAYLFIRHDKQYKIESLQQQMDPFTEIIYDHRDDIATLSTFLPKELRVTIMDSTGKVLYDNFAEERTNFSNHLDREEIHSAMVHGTGSSIRHSETLGKEYIYYARKFPGLFIRTALEYNTSVKPILTSDNRNMILVVFVLLIALFLLFYFSHQINRPLYALKEFVDRVQKGEGNYDNIKFPDNEFGEVGEKILQAFKQLDYAKRYKQQLTHNIAHELKTPVSSIRGFLETLLQQEELDKEQSHFFLERAYAQTLRLSSLVTDISTLNNIEESSVRYDIEKINIRKCIREIEDDLSFKLTEQNSHIYVDIAGKLEIKGVYLSIYSLFKNLIDNSIEHGGKGIDIYIETARIEPDFVWFRYWDTGKGVPEEHLERLFERFYRVEASRSRKNGGSGLGLSIVKNAVLQHKGTITVKNRTEGGLLFDFSLSADLSLSGS